MQEHATDADVFIRSMASRGHLGGLAWATPQAIRVLDASGFDVVLVETVGVGQSEVEVAGTADTTVVLLAPGMGDGVQAAKAGILEIGDVFVVNKADRDGAEATARELRHMITLGSGPRSGPVVDPWSPPVLSTVASRGEGVEHVLAALDAHRDWLARTAELGARRLARAVAEVEAIAFGVLRQRMGGLGGGERLEALAALVVTGQTDPYAAADALVTNLATEARPSLIVP
jgi:LAO/AO transport system kinase